MKTLLIAINSQYVHSNLAVHCLKAACDESCGEVTVHEYSVNEPLQIIYSGILRQRPDIVAFSCYIWNIEYVMKLTGDLKKAAPEVVIIAGGPEVSYDTRDRFEGSVDYVIAGEGEEKLAMLLRCLKNGSKPDAAEIKWLQGFSTVENLEALPSPYRSIEKMSMMHKIAYIEASRGCPFSCAYCISSTTRGVRYFPMDKVREALENLVESGTHIIKFVDRTFNANEKRALEIWEYILKFSDRGIVFHFEIDPCLISGKMLKCLARMPAGLVQIEAGIQSIHQKTLSAVDRPWLIEKAFSNLQQILAVGNIHVHVDLIAGLPLEGYLDFRKSFNRVYGLQAHHFQMGFLKLLRGSPMVEKSRLFDYRFRDYPPYEIISNQDLTAEELLRLKDIETCVDLFYNSGRFVTTLKAITEGKVFADPFCFYEALSRMMREKGYFDKPVKAADLYSVMLDFVRAEIPFLADAVTDTMRLDYLRSFQNPSIPPVLQPEELSRKLKQKRMIKYRSELERILPRLQYQSMEEVWHQIYIGRFNFPSGMQFPGKAIIAVDFGDISPVTGLAGAYLLEEITV